MASIVGVAWPLMPNEHGKFNTVADAAYVDQIIQMSLSDCESANPFQDLGFPVELIFDSATGFNFAKIRMLVEDTFTKLEEFGLAELLTYEMSPVQDNTFIVSISYLNIISGETKNVNQVFV